jgi:hypothetical protein
MGYRHASLVRVRAGTFKARKVIPADVRPAHARLYGQRWEAIFSAPAGTPPAEAKAAHAEWLALVERRIARLRMSPRLGLHDAEAPLRAAVPAAVPQAVAVQTVPNDGATGRAEPPGPTRQPAEQEAPVRHANVALYYCSKGHRTVDLQ